MVNGVASRMNVLSVFCGPSVLLSGCFLVWFLFLFWLICLSFMEELKKFCLKQTVERTIAANSSFSALVVQCGRKWAQC